MSDYKPSEIRTSPSARTLFPQDRYDHSEIELKWQKKRPEEKIYKAGF